MLKHILYTATHCYDKIKGGKNRRESELWILPTLRIFQWGQDKISSSLAIKLISFTAEINIYCFVLLKLLMTISHDSFFHLQVCIEYLLFARHSSGYLRYIIEQQQRFLSLWDGTFGKERQYTRNIIHFIVYLKMTSAIEKNVK